MSSGKEGGIRIGQDLDAAEISPYFPFDQPASIERLREYPFFAEVNDRVLAKLQANIAEQTFQPGDTILRMGEYGDAAYYIAEGVVEVSLGGLRGREPTAKPEQPAAQTGVAAMLTGMFKRGGGPAPSKLRSDAIELGDMPVAVAPGETVLLEAGELFGEMSALSRYPISADVTAKTETVCLLIGTSALRRMLKKKEFAEFKEGIDERYRRRTLASHLASVDLFAELDQEVIHGLRDRAELLSFEPGENIVEQGATDRSFYLVRGGYVKLGLQSGSGDLAVTYLRKGDYAGEVSMLLDEPWPFTLTALEHVELVRLKHSDFEEAISAFPSVQKMLWETAVQRLKERGFSSRNPLSSQYLQMAMDTGLIHGESVLLIDLNVCTRCDDCVRGCASTHGGIPRFIREGITYRNWSIPTSCYQCTDPVCMIGCPTGAISRPIGAPEVLINDDTCIGCGNCARRCPWGNIINVPFESASLGREIQLATKCDQCFGRDAGPACVQMCPHDAAIRINFKEIDKIIETLSGV